MDVATLALAKKYANTQVVSKMDAINANYFFADDTARDTYFVANPTEKVAGVLVSSADVYQMWDGAAWVAKTPISGVSKTDFDEVAGKLDNFEIENSILRPLSVKTEMNPLRIPCISFIDDDGSVEVFTKTKPVFDSKNVKANFCVYGKPIKDGESYVMTPAQLLELQTDGHEILSHGWVRDKRVDDCTESQMRTEFDESKKYLKSLGLDVNSFVWQGGNYNQTALNLVPYYYDSAWAIDNGYGINCNKNNPFEQYKAHRIGLDNLSLTAAKAEVDKVVTNGGWLVFMMHSWYEQWTEGKLLDLAELIDYIQALEIDIVTVKEGLERFGNIIDYGIVFPGTNAYFKITKQGEIQNKYNRFFSQPRNTVMVDTPPTFFKEMSMNITYHDSQTTATGFPDIKTGTLITQKGFDGSAIQYWYPYTANPNHSINWRYHIRRSNSTTTFGDWMTTPYILRKDYSWIPPTVLANSYATKTLDISDLGVPNSYMVVVSFSSLPEGIIWSYVSTNTTVTFTFYNMTGETIHFGTRYPKVVAYTC